jgi:endonuclease/exonuclease/phosphatase family metal-dependent hydrolase
VAQHHQPKGTYSSRFPTVRIDHIFISPGLEVTGINVPASEFARIASDHLPLIAKVRIPSRNTP